MFENYEIYLKFLNEKLTKFFNSQKQYIFCTKGCGKCCKNAQFPYSLMEIKYLLAGFLRLDKATQDIIEANLQKVAEEKKNFKGEKFMYDCPFLVNDVCSVYQYRGVICRSFGLMTTSEDGRIKAPFCCFEGYNYSNVMNKRGTKISSRKFKALGVKEEPTAFNVSYKFLTSQDFEQTFHFLFGEKKPLIDWFLPENNSGEAAAEDSTNEQAKNNISVA